MHYNQVKIHLLQIFSIIFQIKMACFIFLNCTFLSPTTILFGNLNIVSSQERHKQKLDQCYQINGSPRKCDKDMILTRCRALHLIFIKLLWDEMYKRSLELKMFMYNLSSFLLQLLNKRNPTYHCKMINWATCNKKIILWNFLLEVKAQELKINGSKCSMTSF